MEGIQTRSGINGASQNIYGITKVVRIKQVLQVILLLVTGASSAQQGLPDKPEIRFVSIDTITGATVIEWNASTTSGIRSYHIYTLDISTTPVTGSYLDSVPGSTLSYSYDAGATDHSVYTVTAVDQAGNESLLSGDYHKPVVLEMTYDSCNATMLLEWEKYIGWRHHLTGYRVNILDSTGYFVHLMRLDTNTLSFTHTGIEENRQYDYFVEAYDSRGFTSTSNISSHFTYMPPPPSYLNLNYVTVLDDRTVEISFSADLSSEINDFVVTRGRSAYGSFIPIDTLMDVTEPYVIVTDEIPVQNGSYYYRAEALNSCLNTISVSNPGNNIFLQEESIAESLITLKWNPYEEFASGVSEYSVYRQDQRGEYILAGTTRSDETLFTEDIRQTGNEMIPGLIRYRVEAHESGANPLGQQGSSWSNEIGVGVKSTVYMPNAFTPNNDRQNDVFLPVMDFIPESYQMIIFDRSGKILFQTENLQEGWDGTMNGNEKAKPGVYIYHIEYQSYNGSRNEETGHVTLIYPQN